MFKLLLISKYLRRKLAPLFAAVAVMLCTAMVIIVMSVMGGFLNEFRRSAHNLTGDVVVQGPFQGFAGYEQIIADIENLPEVAVATPLIDAVALANFGDDAKPVRVQGVDMAKLDAIVGYRNTLVWSKEDLIKHTHPPDNERGRAFTQKITRDHPADPSLTADYHRDDPMGLPEAIIGIEVNPYQHRDDQGQYSLRASWAGARLPLTVVPITQGGTLGTLEPKRRELLVVNEFKSGLYDIDGQFIFMPFGTLQKMLDMEPKEGLTDFDPETGRGGEKTLIPGRANRLVIKAAPDADVNDVKDKVQNIVAAAYADRPLAAVPRAATWEEIHGQILSAVENEKGLVTFLFGIIGLVAVVMVATTFYMIVLEKTRDIGVLRAIGASRGGIMGLFLGYGLAIGLVGSLTGLALAVGVVTHLNEIQEFIANTFGWRMWNPQTYFFDRIPDEINYTEAWRVVAGAILSSVIGATLPAWIAGRLKPVDALRYE